LLDECEILEEHYLPSDNPLDASGYDRLLECVGSPLGVL